jgi:GNAT superfamily N-acetyltransferase
MTRHPEHDAVSSTVRSWFTASTPAIGLSVVPTSHGFLGRSDRAERRRLVLTVDAAGSVADALASAVSFYETSAFEVWVDDRSRAERLTAALISAGMEPVQDTVVLALVGSVVGDLGPGGLTVEDVIDLVQLQEWARVKVQAFADAEDDPDSQQLQAEVAERQVEWPVCRYQLARLGGEAVAILGHYTGQDQMVFNLATRRPFRHRGIAGAMLAHWSAQGHRQGVRSHLINCDDGGPADALYRRLGFTDEVYWYRRFRPRP